jgi:RNA 3'-phosphate cyclase
MIEIDGSYLEGGGQIVRTALSISQIKKIPCLIFNIRKNRENPGLQIQHLSFIQALKNCFGASVKGDEIGSQEIEFFPGNKQEEKIKIKINTAACIPLILQGLLLPLILGKKQTEIEIEGGATDTFFGPTLDYFETCFLAFLEKFKIKVQIKIIKRGYYPAGGAKIIFLTFPWEKEKIKQKEIVFQEKGKSKRIILFSRASNFLKERKVAERQISSVKEILKVIDLPIQEEITYHQTDCPGSSLFIGVLFENTILGVDQIGKIGKSAEEIGKETALSLLEEDKKGGFFDSHLQDQILPYLFILNKEFKIKIGNLTKHFQTNLWVLEKFFKGNLKIENNFVSWKPL